MRKPKHTALIADLIDTLDGRLEHGRDFGGDFTQGDFRIEVHVSVRRVVSPQERRSHERAALEHLRAEPWSALRCVNDVNKGAGKSVFHRRYEHRCEAKVAGVLVVKSLGNRAPLYLGVCKRHLREHGRAASDVLLSFELPERELQEIRDAFERKTAAERASEEAGRP